MYRRATIATALAVLSTTTLGAQSVRTGRPADNCNRYRDDYAQVCETRDFTIAAVKSLTIDGRDNGGIAVHGWDKSEIQVVATVSAHAETEAEASDIAKQVSIATNGGDIRANAEREKCNNSHG